MPESGQLYNKKYNKKHKKSIDRDVNMAGNIMQQRQQAVRFR